MAIQVDQQFIKKVQNLVQEVLSDEARFVARNEQTLASLHNHIFSKANEMPFKNMEEKDRAFFKKYFYLNNNVNTPRQDMAFTDSVDDQAFFFDQFRSQVKFCTFGYDRLDFLRPTFTDDKATAPTFNADQSALLVRGVVFPLLHSLEQREIALIEQKKTGKAVATEEDNENPYNQLADKVLVKGVSGQFDTVLTYAQIEEIAGQEDQLRKQGLPQEQVVKLLQEYITKRFPELNLYLSPEGKIITFLSSVGISASGLEPVKPGAPAVPGQSVAPIDGAISFVELTKEMKFRQARKLQYKALIAAKGNLSFSTANFQVASAAGPVTINGLTVQLDQAGQGSNAVFFLADRQGVMAKVIVDTASYRINGKPDFHFSMYDKPEEDSPGSHKMKVKHDDLPRLNIPLKALYNQLQQSGEFSPTPDKFVILKPVTAVNVPIVPPSLNASGMVPPPLLPGQMPNEGSFSMAPKPKLPTSAKKPLEMMGPGEPLPLGAQGGPVVEQKFVMPKLSASKVPLPPQPKAKTEVPGEIEQPKPGVQPKIQASGSPKPAVSGGISKGKSIWSKVALVGGATAAPILGTIAGGALQLFT